MDFLISLFLGISLAACAGLRAFLPLFIIGLGARMGWMETYQMAPSFAWLSTNQALFTLGMASLVEVLADKVPAVDHAVDQVFTFIRPAAGATSVLAVLSPDNPVVAYTAAVMVAGSTTLPVHLAKTSGRLTANLATAGFAAPVASVAEDATATFGSFLAIFLPVVAFILVAICGLLFWKFVGSVRKLFRRRKKSPEPDDDG